MKKIMFNDRYGLTQAVLDGRKTQTRRIINPQPEVSERIGMVWKGYGYGITTPYGSPYFLRDVYHNFLSGTNYPQCRRYKVGEVVAVAQSYKDAGYDQNMLQTATVNGNIGDYPISQLPGWNNKMFTYSSMMPYRIHITDVRVERLNDISESDIKAEGIDYVNGYSESYFFGFGVKTAKGWIRLGNTPREAYATLIDKISGKGTWESNPYVFAYTFELVK